jgi:hydrogenase maturation protein HypF
LIRIIGIGSPFGDDVVGLEVARLLAQAPPPHCEVIVADRPGTNLIELLHDVDGVILVDAAHSGAAAGTLHKLTFDALAQSTVRFNSSHDLGVVETIQLARKLGYAPVHGRVLGIEIASVTPRTPCALSQTAQHAVTRAQAQVRSWVEELDASALQSTERASCQSNELSNRARQRLLVKGIVQGVGFRPLVWRLASSLRLAGFVRNLADGVEVEIEGTRENLDAFRRQLACETQPPATIRSIDLENRQVHGETTFRVIASEKGRGTTTIPPDLAICAECLSEILDPAHRRYRYPFTNCTSCGPRFTVIQTLPYDRPTTTMRGFPLCVDCQSEYLDPGDRRFRAEPIACPQCGPSARLEIWQKNIAAVVRANDPIADAADIIRRGGIVAVQGIGGIHLSCDAANEDAVSRLRAIKRRPRKPFAVMVDSLHSAASLAIVSDDEAALLGSSQAPIVLAQKKGNAPLAPSIAPGNDYVGLMIAYSPLHQLLIRDAGRPLLMTSANLPGEPLARTCDDARATFGATTEALLLHNRPIHQRCDDSVWAVGRMGPQPIRLSRGAAPCELTVPVEASISVLGIGADLKNNFCLLSGGQALMSQYIGNLESAATQEHFRDSLEKWLDLTGRKPGIAAHDLHPQSLTRVIASRLCIPTVAVQHHHAHLTACMAEHGYKGPVIGIAFDGTGYGEDGAIWGGEAMIANYSEFRRVSNFQYLPLPGGDAAIRHPARIAAAFELALFGEIADRRLRERLGTERVRVLSRMVERRINTVQTSSCGRLFDAVAALLGVCDEVSYEAQAPIELETLARQSYSTNRIYPCSLTGRIVRVGEILAAVQEDIEHEVAIADIARAFHDTLAEVVSRMALDAKAESGIGVVVLSGGCFQNRVLLAGSVERLQNSGFVVLVHHHVPTNDGGLALGQAVVAAARLNAGVERGSVCA